MVHQKLTYMSAYRIDLLSNWFLKPTWLQQGLNIKYPYQKLELKKDMFNPFVQITHFFVETFFWFRKMFEWLNLSPFIKKLCSSYKKLQSSSWSFKIFGNMETNRSKKLLIRVSEKAPRKKQHFLFLKAEQF